MRRMKLPGVLLNTALLACSLVTILPFFWMLSSALKTNAEISALNTTFFSQAPTLANFQNALERMNFMRYFLNSLAYAVGLTAITVYTSAISGFVL